MPSPVDISETCLYTTDLDRAIDFYTRVMGLRVVSLMDARGVVLRVSPGHVLIIFNQDVTRSEDSIAPKHGCDGEGHIAFQIDARGFDKWRQHLAAQGVPIEREVDWPRGGHSIYFRDPSGTSVELIGGDLWPE